MKSEIKKYTDSMKRSRKRLQRFDDINTAILLVFVAIEIVLGIAGFPWAFIFAGFFLGWAIGRLTARSKRKLDSMIIDLYADGYYRMKECFWDLLDFMLEEKQKWDGTTKQKKTQKKKK